MQPKYQEAMDKKVNEMMALFKLPINSNIKPQHYINGASLFANVGIDEAYFEENGIKIKVSNELLEERANFYKHLYPDVNMICGDITKTEIFNALVKEYKKNSCEFLIATPPCQGMSLAGKQSKNDVRNFLIIKVIDFIKAVQPTNIIIENVPQILTTKLTISDNDIFITDLIKQELEPLGYFINYKVCDACDYNTPQHRKRCIFLISKIKKWEFPKENKNWITTRDAIGDLPSLEAGQHSNIKYHNAKPHSDRHILWMKHTPTGKTALDNEVYYPQKDGRKIKGYSTTYKRIEWDVPAPTITMCNGSLSSQNNGHPGRLLPDGTYSDARVLTILELLRLTGLPDDWKIPEWANENLVREVIGECFPPKFASAMLKTMPL